MALQMERLIPMGQTMGRLKSSANLKDGLMLMAQEMGYLTLRGSETEA